MKRIFFFLAAILISSASLLTSCTEDNPVDTPPTINFVSGAGLISDDATLAMNTPFEIKILAEANASSQSKIQSLKVTRVFDLQSVDTTYDGFNDATLSLTIGFVSASSAGVERIEFKVTDKDGFTATIDLNITTENATTPIRTFTMKILGSYDSNTGSSFASINGSVYTLTQAFANQASVDFLYWWGSATNATIGAPDDPNANLVYTGVNGLPNWTIKNATRFKTTNIAVATFDAIEDGIVLSEDAAGSNQTRIPSLAVNDVIAFITVTGKSGLIKVTNINAGAAGDITIDVKVEE